MRRFLAAVFAVACGAGTALAQAATPIIGLPLANPAQTTDSLPACQQSGCTMANSLSSMTVAQIATAAGGFLGVTASASSFGAKCDIVTEEQDGTMALGSPVLKSSAYTFPASAVGKHAVVVGAGTAGATLSATILSVSGKNATLSGAAGTAVSTQNWYYGTDDSAALASGLTAVAATGTNPGALLISGRCGTTVQLELPATAGQTGFQQEGGITGTIAGLDGIYALATMTSVLHRGNAFALYGGVQNLLIECGGLCTNGIYVEGGGNGYYRNIVIADDTASGGAYFRIGNGTDNVIGMLIDHLSCRIDPNAFTAEASYGVWFNTNATDNHVVHLQPCEGAATYTYYSQGANNHLLDFHITAPTPPALCPTYGIYMTGLGDDAIQGHIDCASTGGIYVGQTQEAVDTAMMNHFTGLTGALGVEIANGVDFVRVTGARTNISAMQGTNLVVQDGSSGANTCVSGNPGASYTHAGTGC